MTHHRAAEVRARLARAHGHLHAVIEMLDHEREPAEVVRQIRAVRAALDKATTILIDEMLEECDAPTPRARRAQLDAVRAAVKTLS